MRTTSLQDRHKASSHIARMLHRKHVGDKIHFGCGGGHFRSGFWITQKLQLLVDSWLQWIWPLCVCVWEQGSRRNSGITSTKSILRPSAATLSITSYSNTAFRSPHGWDSSPRRCATYVALLFVLPSSVCCDSSQDFGSDKIVKGDPCFYPKKFD